MPNSNDSDSANCSAKLTDKPSSRRVSFASSNFIKKFAIDSEKNTIWDTTYEEMINSDSTQSSENALGTFSIHHASEVHSVVQYQSKANKTHSPDNQNQSNFNEVDMEITEINGEDFNREHKSESSVSNNSLEYTCYIPVGNTTYLKCSNMTVTESNSMEFTQGMFNKFIPQQINATTMSHVNMDQTCRDGNKVILEKNGLKKAIKIQNPENQNQSNFNEVDMEITETSLEYTCQIPIGHLTYVKDTNMSLAESNSMELTQGIVNKFLPQQINATTRSHVSMDQTCRDRNKTILGKNGSKKAINIHNPKNRIQSNFNEVDVEITETNCKDLTNTAPTSKSIVSDNSLEYTCEIPMGRRTYVESNKSNSMELTQGIFNKFIPQQINATTTSHVNMEQTCSDRNKTILKSENQSKIIDNDFVEMELTDIVNSNEVNFKNNYQKNDKNNKCNDIIVNKNDKGKENLSILEKENVNELLQMNSTKKPETDVDLPFKSNGSINNTVIGESSSTALTSELLYKENVVFQQPNAISPYVNMDQSVPIGTKSILEKSITRKRIKDAMDFTNPINVEDFLNDAAHSNTLNYRNGHNSQKLNGVKEKVLDGPTTKCKFPNKTILKTSKYKENQSINAQSSVELNCIDNNLKLQTLNLKLEDMELSEKRPHSKNSSYNFSACTDDTQQLINYNLSNGQRKFGDSNFSYANSKILLPTSCNSSGFPMSLENTLEVKENIEFTDFDNSNVGDIICKNNLKDISQKHTKTAQEFHISQESFCLSDSILSNDSFLTIHQNTLDLISNLRSDQVLKNNELLETCFKNNESIQRSLKEFNQKMKNSLEQCKTLMRDLKGLHQEDLTVASRIFKHHSLEEIENNLIVSDRTSFDGSSNQESVSNQAISGTETNELSELSSNLDEVLTIKEQIEKKYTRSKRILKIITVTDNFCKITTLCNTIQICVHFTKLNGTVQEMQVNPSISENSQPIVVLLHECFIERLKEKKLRSAIGDKYDIFSLLDYIRLEMQKNLELLKQYTHFELEFNCAMDHNFMATFEIITLKDTYRVSVDMSDLDNISEKSITVSTENFNMKQESLKKFFNKTSKGLTFLKLFLRDFQNFVII